MEELVKSLGFDSVQEYHKLVANADLTDPKKMKAFEDWKENDGSKEGLMKLYSENSSTSSYL